jgi:hypothetical protein
MDASQYKDYVLVLLFIKYISDKYAGKINKNILGPLAKANPQLSQSDFADFNDPNKLGSGKEMVERLTNLISIFGNPALDFSKNRAAANPPFSDKRWSTGLDPANDPFQRFTGYGVPPDKQGDYAYLLHIIRSLKSTGKGACILQPHLRRRLEKGRPTPTHHRGQKQKNQNQARLLHRQKEIRRRADPVRSRHRPLLYCRASRFVERRSFP